MNLLKALKRAAIKPDPASKRQLWRVWQNAAMEFRLGVGRPSNRSSYFREQWLEPHAVATGRGQFRLGKSSLDRLRSKGNTERSKTLPVSRVSPETIYRLVDNQF